MPPTPVAAHTGVMDNTTQTPDAGNTGNDVGNPETDHTVDDAEVEGGYGGPLPADPGVEQADAAPTD